MVGRTGFEPVSRGSKPRILSVELTAHDFNVVADRRIELRYWAYETRQFSRTGSPHYNLVETVGFEPTTPSV